MLSTAATRGRNVSIVSSWKEETSATTTPSGGNVSACAASGVPMLPPISTGRDRPPSSAPVSAEVVVLPLVPVMATVSASMARQPSSSSPITGTPRLRAGASCEPSTGTPGLMTTSSVPAKAAAPSTRCTPSAASAATSRPSEATGFRSVARTSAWAAASRRAAATPRLARPTTVTRRPASVASHFRPRVAIASLNSITRARPSPELQRGERQQRERERDDPEPHDDLRLGPAVELVMVMERRHPEHAPPGELEAGHLQDHRARLHDVEPADERQEQLRLREDGQHSDRGAQGQ